MPIPFPIGFLATSGETVIFFDDFNRANSTTIGNDWTEVEGDFQIISERLSILGVTAGNEARIIRPSGEETTDGWAQCVPRFADCQVGFRWDAVSTLDGYSAQVQASNHRILRYASGGATVIASGGANLDKTDDILRISIVGSTIKTYVNGVEDLSVNDGTYSGPGRQGIATTVARNPLADDFSHGTF